MGEGSEAYGHAPEERAGVFFRISESECVLDHDRSIGGDGGEFSIESPIVVTASFIKIGPIWRKLGPPRGPFVAASTYKESKKREIRLKKN